MASKNWIAGATKNAHGQFRAKAKKAGMSTKAYAMKAQNSSNPTTRRQAILAETLMKINKKGKK